MEGSPAQIKNMSKIYELLQKTAERSEKKHFAFRCVKLVVFVGGECNLMMDDRVIATGLSETEIENELMSFLGVSETAGA